MALETSLISYWKMDESSDGSGAVTRADSHGSNNLTDNNTTASGTGILSNGADFELDNSEYLSHADNADLSFGNEDMSISVWVNAETLGGLAAAKIISKADGGAAANLEYDLDYLTSSTRFRFLVSDGTNVGIAVADQLGAPSAATWYHIVGYHDATANVVGIVVDSGTADTTAHTTGIQDLTKVFHVGATNDGGITFEWDGIIDEFGLWGKVLSTAEIRQLYNSGAARPYPLDPQVSGSITNTGTTIQTTLKAIVGAITNTGALSQYISVKVVAGAITNTGTTIQTTLKVVAGAITNTGALTSLLIRPIVIRLHAKFRDYFFPSDAERDFTLDAPHRDYEFTIDLPERDNS